MQTVLLVSIFILLCTTVFFGYHYFRFGKMSASEQQMIEQLNSLAIGGELQKVEGDSALHKALNHALENMKKARDNIDAFASEVTTTGDVLHNIGEEAVEKAEVVRAAIDEVGKGLRKQLNVTKESLVSVEDMNVAIEDMAVRSNEIAEQSDSTLQLTIKGNEKLQQSIDNMGLFGQTINTTFDAIKILGEKSKEIGQIVQVITGISSQINLLALNAAIEAARAGEHGKGFAVVADEVRKLAEQTTSSATEVSNIVKNIQDETSRVVVSMTKGTDEFAETNKAIVEIAMLFEQSVAITETIADNNMSSSANAEELASSSQHIMESIQQITFISEESVEMFDELFVISDEELAMMSQLLHLIDKFVAMQQLTKDFIGEQTVEN